MNGTTSRRRIEYLGIPHKIRWSNGGLTTMSAFDCQIRALTAVQFPDYSFTHHRLDVRPGIGMHFLDEGPRDGEVVVMLHGNPSWSYYWRHLVHGLRDRYRCIVPDHIGMGLSDKPDDAKRHRRATTTPWHRGSRICRRCSPISEIDGPITLAVHDWGGMIGFGWALEHMPQVGRLVITNTAAFPMPSEKPMPWQIALGRDYTVGEWIIRGFNALAIRRVEQQAQNHPHCETTFATRKLQPVIMSEGGKALIQTCLNSPDTPPSHPQKTHLR